MAVLLSAPTKNAIQKTLDSQLLNTAGNGDPITLSDVDGIPDLPGVCVIRRIDSNNQSTPSLREYIEYSGTSGSTIIIETRNVDGSNTALTHPVGSIVEFIPDVTWADRIYDALSNVVNVDTLAVDTTKVVTPAGAQTLSAKIINGATFASLSLNIPSSAAGDLFYRNSDGIVARLALGTDGQVLTANASLPYWGTSSNSVGSDGWTTISDTLTYASATSFTIAGVDRTTTYTPGTRIKLTQTSAKYFVVTSSSFSTNTTVNITAGTSYTLANAAITSPYYSYQVNPQGFPGWFAYTPTFTGFSADPTVGTSRFRVVGRSTLVQHSESATGTSNATTMTISLPITSANLAGANWVGSGQVRDNGTTQTNAGSLVIGSNASAMNVYKDFVGSNWTGSGNKQLIYGQIEYEI